MVNMTLKYLYLVSGIDSIDMVDSPTREIAEAIKKDSKSLHVPIDSYIIDEIWLELSKKDRKKLPLRQKNPVIPKYEKDDYKRPSDYIKPWSSWNKCDYHAVCELVKCVLEKKNKDPLEWEAEAWIASAKRRRKQEDDRDKPCKESK